MLKLSALRSFVEIDNSMSFQEAAQRLNVSQSAISTQIRLLEAELNVALFDRSARPPVMTPMGRAILGPAREILAQVSLITHLVSGDPAAARPLMLGVIPTASVGLLPEGLAELARHSPASRIAVETGLSAPLVARVQAGRLDAAIVTGPIDTPPGLSAKLVLRERLVIVAHGDLRPRPAIANLKRQAFLRFHPDYGIRQIIDRFLTARGIETQDVMRLDTVDAILAMAEQGLGVAIVPEHAVARARRPTLRVTPIPDPEASRDVVIVWRDKSACTERVIQLIDAFRAIAKTAP